MSPIPSLPPPLPTRINLSTLCCEILSRRRIRLSVKEEQAIAVCSMFGHYLRRQVTLDDLTEANLSGFLRGLIDQGKSIGFVRRRRRLLIVIAICAYELGRLRDRQGRLRKIDRRRVWRPVPHSSK